MLGRLDRKFLRISFRDLGLIFVCIRFCIFCINVEKENYVFFMFGIGKYKD